jgi:hypothetical protein
MYQCRPQYHLLIIVSFVATRVCSQCGVAHATGMPTYDARRRIFRPSGELREVSGDDRSNVF